MSDALAPLREFVQSMTAVVNQQPDERSLLAQARPRLAALLTQDTWLPADCAVPRNDRYAQYLLHCDPLERFSVVSFVWRLGQQTPVHDHTVWGLIGMLRGAERCEEYTPPQAGNSGVAGRAHVMNVGDIEAVSPTLGDWHRVTSCHPQHDSISIHVYGANIGATRRHRIDEAGRVVDFVSGYDNATVPNLWDRSAAVRAALPGGRA